MVRYKRSICSTCRYTVPCVLTHDKGSVSSCSEYVHKLEEDQGEIFIESPVRMFSSSGLENTHNELIAF